MIMKLNPKEDYEGRPVQETIAYYQDELKKVLALPEVERWTEGKTDVKTPVIMKRMKEKVAYNINERIKELSAKD